MATTQQPRDEAGPGAASTGQPQQDQPFYKKKRFLIPAGVYALVKVAGKLKSGARTQRRRRVVKRLDERQRAASRRDRKTSYRIRNPRPRRR